MQYLNYTSYTEHGFVANFKQRNLLNNPKYKVESAYHTHTVPVFGLSPCPSHELAGSHSLSCDVDAAVSSVQIG